MTLLFSMGVAALSIYGTRAGPTGVSRPGLCWSEAHSPRSLTRPKYLQRTSPRHEGGAWDEHSLGKRRGQKVLSGFGAQPDGEGFCRVVGGSRAVHPAPWGSVPGYPGLQQVSSAGPVLSGTAREPGHCAAPQKIQHSSLHRNAASRDASWTEICSLFSGVGWGTHALFDIFVAYICRTS